MCMLRYNGLCIYTLWLMYVYTLYIYMFIMLSFELVVNILCGYENRNVEMIIFHVPISHELTIDQ